MKRIDLSNIIESKGLDKNELAKQLFPNNKYPSMALSRVMQGEAVLDATQISKLSALTGLSMDELFSQEGWVSKISSDVITFVKGNYKAELDVKTSITKVYHENSLFHEEHITPKTISLKEYVIYLNTIIKNKTV